LKSCSGITDDGRVSDVVEDLLAEVRAARRTGAAHERHHARVKELLVQVRRERPDLGLADIEQLIDRYFDRGTISRITVPELGEQLTRKPRRKRAGS
jgi:hypothetical protein